MKLKKGIFPLIFACALGVLLLVQPAAAVSGVREGLQMCAAVAIPSLFPFLTVSSFAASCPASGAISRVLSPAMRVFFRLPGSAGAAVFFGLVGGFPVGCSVTAQLLEQKKITREQAQRMSLFLVNAGPAFVLTAVGSVMLGNKRAGAIIFASLCLSTLVIGFFLRFFGTPEAAAEKKIEENHISNSQALVDATQKSTFAMLKICAWITLFSCCSSIISALGVSGRAAGALKCIFEVTGGCACAAESGNLFTVAATLGWAGLCVCCQVLEDVRRIGTPSALFFAFRALNAALSAVICYALTLVFPIEQSVFSSLSAPAAAQSFSVSAPAAAALLCLCAVFVFDLDRNGKVC